MTIEVAKSDKKTPFFIVALVVLALVNIILVYLMMQGKQESIEKDTFIEKQKVELEETGSKLDSLNRELDIRIAEAKKTNRDYQSLLEIQEQLKQDIVNMKTENGGVEKIIQEYDAKIRNYEAVLAKKDTEIEGLQGDKSKLSTEVIKEKTEKTKLADSISSITRQKEELEATVAKASVLKSEGVKIEGIDAKNRVDDDGRFKAKNLERLKVTTKLYENAAARMGSKDMYIRIVEPTGAVMVGADGGRFRDSQGKDLNYTLVQTFIFDNINRAVVVTFRKGNAFQKGLHELELYCEGNLVGKNSFEVN